MCARHGGGDINLFVRKGGASQKILGNTELKQWINRCFNTIYGGEDTVKQWYCYNCIEMWLGFRPRQFRTVSGEPPAATRGTPVEKHCSNLTRKKITESMLATKIKNKHMLWGQRVLQC